MDRKPLKIGDLTARIPVIQGGMGVGISLSHLAGSVAANGGVGILSAAQIGFREPDFEEHPKEANLRAIQSQLAKARALAGGGIVGFNIMVATKDYADYVKAAVKAGADLIISGAGLPEKLPEYVKGSNTKIAPIVSTEKAAKADKTEKAAKKKTEKKPSFFHGLKKEYKKIVFADKETVAKQTVAVIFMSVVIGVIIAVLDMVMKFGLSFIL